MMTTSIENNKRKIFVDTNVILDALTQRDDTYKPSQNLFRLIARGIYDGYICSKQITDIHYTLMKYFNNKDLAKVKIKILCNLFEILPLFKGDILACLNKNDADFEDAILCEVAKVNMIPCLITNNIKDYQKSWPIMVMTPEQFLTLNQ